MTRDLRGAASAMRILFWVWTAWLAWSVCAQVAGGAVRLIFGGTIERLATTWSIESYLGGGLGFVASVVIAIALARLAHGARSTGVAGLAWAAMALLIAGCAIDWSLFALQAAFKVTWTSRWVQGGIAVEQTLNGLHFAATIAALYRIAELGDARPPAALCITFLVLEAAVVALPWGNRWHDLPLLQLLRYGSIAVGWAARTVLLAALAGAERRLRALSVAAFVHPPRAIGVG
jgi:hypothetical protein